MAPGATKTYTFTITASNNPGSGYTSPLTGGTNNLTFDIVREGTCWFADPASPCDASNARFKSPNITIAAAPVANAGGALATICQGGASAALGGSVSGSATGGTWSDGGIGGTFSPNATTLNATWKPPVAKGWCTIKIINS